MVKTIFICHSPDLVKKLYETYKNPIILFVGPNDINKVE